MEKRAFFKPIILVLLMAPSATPFGNTSGAEFALEGMGSEIVTSELSSPSVANVTFMRPIDPDAVPLIQIDEPPDAISGTVTAQDASATNAPMLIGQGIDVPPPNIDYARIRWQLQDNVWIGHFDIRASGAETLRAALQIVDTGGRTALPAEVRDKIVLRYGGRDQKAFEVGVTKIMERDDYWTALIPGDVIHVEVLVPSAIHPEAIGLRIPHLSYFPKSHRKQQYADGFHYAGNCQRDVACRPSTPALRQASDAVAKIIYTQRNGYSYTCTGTLLNNQNSPKRPLFVTARHCISTPGEARSVVTIWHYQTTECGGSAATIDRRVTQRHGGATLLSAHPVLDIALLALNESPPVGAQYQGWSTRKLARDEAVQGIHHPRGDAKKHSIGRVTYVDWWRGDRGASAGIEVSWAANHDAGVTEGGSSGSGLFTLDDNGLLAFRGTLVGGSSSCRNPLSWRTDTYIPFSDFFPSVRHYF